jgi:hypothetical protein
MRYGAHSGNADWGAHFADAKYVKAQRAIARELLRQIKAILRDALPVAPTRRKGHD